MIKSSTRLITKFRIRLNLITNLVDILYILPKETWIKLRLLNITYKIIIIQTHPLINSTYLMLNPTPTPAYWWQTIINNAKI